MNEYQIYEYYMLMVDKIAAFLNISPVELNVYLFLFVIPITFTTLFTLLIIQSRRVRQLKKGYHKQRKMIRQLHISQESLTTSQ